MTSANNVTASLSLQSVSKHFGPVKAVDGIDLAVGQDEFFSLLGPSGSGKTTLLRIIAGLERPTTGRVVVRGQDVTEMPPYRRRIGMVFQNFLLFPHKTVAENIIFPLRMQRVARTERDERLAWVTQFASGFSWILMNSGPSMRLEKFTIGTLTAMPSKSAG